MYRFTLVVIAFAALAYTYAETDCESHRRASGPSSAHQGMSWNITCDANGKYMPKQCTTNGDWCTCYHPDGAATGPSRNRKHCECEVEKYQKTQANSECKPECQANGLYKKSQCCNNSCHCVDEKTGKTVTCPPSS